MYNIDEDLQVIQDAAMEEIKRVAYNQGYRDAKRYVGWFLERAIERPVPPEYIPQEQR